LVAGRSLSGPFSFLLPTPPQPLFHLISKLYEQTYGEKFTHRRMFMESLCKRAGVKQFGFKAFRKYGPSVLNDIHRVSIKKLQRLLRHKTQTTTEIYLKKIDDDLSVGLRLLEKRDTQTKKEATYNG